MIPAVESVFAALAVILPLSLGGAVSPMMLTEQSLLLSTAGRPAANRYAVGAVLTLLVFVVLLVFLGGVISLPTAPTLSATLDIILGVGLLLVGGGLGYLFDRRSKRLQSREPGEQGDGEQGASVRAEAAFTFGLFSMATNFTTLPLAAVAAKEIASADLESYERIILILVLVTICSLPAWAPLALTGVAPKAGQRVLDLIRGLIARYGRTAVVLLLVGAGAFLVIRGIVNV